MKRIAKRSNNCSPDTTQEWLLSSVLDWTGKRSISDGEEVSREKGRAVLDTESPDMLRASPVQQIPARPPAPVSVESLSACRECLYGVYKYGERSTGVLKRSNEINKQLTRIELTC